MDGVMLIHLVWIVPLALLALYLGSPRFMGTAARRHVTRVLRSGLDKHRYSVFEGLVLPAGGGRFEVDVLVVGRSGIFAIECLECRGSLTGTRVQPMWTERRLGVARRIDNPVHENALRIQHLERLLSLPRSRFHSRVVVAGRDRLESGLPPEVIPANRLLARIHSETHPVLEPEEADRVCSILRRDALRASWRQRRPGWLWLRAAMLLLVIGGAYLAYRAEIHEFAARAGSFAEQRLAPENFHPDGRLKTERERWEERLVCSYSVDTQRCACYEPAGGRADIAAARCRELAERGSVLQR